jgi:hypothetical protein
MSNFNLSDYSARHFIKVDDVREKPLRDVIVDVSLGQYDKLELTFESGDVLSLNGTNAAVLRRHYGKNTNALIGKEIEMHLGTIKFQGSDKEAVRGSSRFRRQTYRSEGCHEGLGAISELD